jgi:hypothetical protein
MLHVALSFVLIFIFLAFTGSTFAPSLELDHELAYCSIAEVETSPLDILSIPCNKFGKSTDDGFEIECKKLFHTSLCYMWLCHFF